MCSRILSVHTVKVVKYVGKNTVAAVKATHDFRVRTAEIAVKQLTKEARTERRRKRLNMDIQNSPKEVLNMTKVSEIVKTKTKYEYNVKAVSRTSDYRERHKFKKIVKSAEPFSMSQGNSVSTSRIKRGPI